MARLSPQTPRHPLMADCSLCPQHRATNNPAWQNTSAPSNRMHPGSWASKPVYCAPPELHLASDRISAMLHSCTHIVKSELGVCCVCRDCSGFPFGSGGWTLKVQHCRSQRPPPHAVGDAGLRQPETLQVCGLMPGERQVCSCPDANLLLTRKALPCLSIPHFGGFEVCLCHGLFHSKPASGTTVFTQERFPVPVPSA